MFQPYCTKQHFSHTLHTMSMSCLSEGMKVGICLFSSSRSLVLRRVFFISIFAKKSVHYGSCYHELFHIYFSSIMYFMFQMCGNGVRCFARFIAEVENLQGTHRCQFMHELFNIR